MRIRLLICAPAALSCCSPPEPALDAQARSELASRYREATVDTLKLQNVRRVNDAVCGEASIEARGRPPTFRLFYYRPGKDAAIDLAPGPRMTADGAQCPTRDHILAVCAPTASEREKAELRIVKCQSRGPF